MATPQSDAPSSIYRIGITLVDVDPPVWRCVEVEDCSLQTLHAVIQDAMGWENYHLYEFRIDDVAYTDPRAVDEDDHSAAEMTLGQLAAKECTQFDYVYDFGDSWEHVIKIEGVGPAESGIHYPRCVDGRRACPPEDCGGPWGYGNLLEALKDPDHDEHDDMLDWIGEDFDAEAFDPQRVNRVWANWDFGDPDSGPDYSEYDKTPREAEEPRAKAKVKGEPKPGSQPRVARNDPCPCGSGKKYKKCCMKKGKDGDYDDD